MAIMTHRTTFSLDELTVQRIRKLAGQWNVSQAEVIRRVVASAELLVAPDPVGMLRTLHESGAGLVSEAADHYLRDVRRDREHWRGA